MPQTRKDTSVFLIGDYHHQITGNKLPSNGDVLRVLFFNIREVYRHEVEKLHPSAVLVVSEVLAFWSKAINITLLKLF